MDLKKKFETAKEKIKARVPEIIGVSSAILIGGVIVYLNRKTSNDSSTDEHVIYIHETDGVDEVKNRIPEGTTYHRTISAEEMSKLLNDGTMTAYSIDENDLTFYNLSDPA